MNDREKAIAMLEEWHKTQFSARFYELAAEGGHTAPEIAKAVRREADDLREEILTLMVAAGNRKWELA